MNRDNSTYNQASIPDDIATQKVSPYTLLMRQSKKLGGAATKTLDITKEFLKQDVASINPDSFLFGGQATRPSDTENMSGRLYLRNPRDIHELARESHEVLAAVKTVWLPTNLFPDSVILDRSKITIIRRNFFWSSEVVTMRVEDILNVSCGTNPFFGSVTVSTRVYNSTDHYEIDYFWRNDAVMLKEMLQGYMIALHNNVELKHLSTTELSETLLELGRDSNY